MIGGPAGLVVHQVTGNELLAGGEGTLGAVEERPVDVAAVLEGDRDGRGAAR
jgi:hypothetical protein